MNNSYRKQYEPHHMVVVCHRYFLSFRCTGAEYAAHTQPERALWFSQIDGGDVGVHECFAHHAVDFGGGRGLGADEIASVV
jgi:hypothetical protein